MYAGSRIAECSNTIGLGSRGAGVSFGHAQDAARNLLVLGTNALKTDDGVERALEVFRQKVEPGATDVAYQDTTTFLLLHSSRLALDGNLAQF